MENLNRKNTGISKKGFTLIELLIVIGILAILATTVVLVLNPAQILAEARDTQRISDLGSVQSAIGLMLATATNTPTFILGPNCTVANAVNLGLSGSCATVTSRAVDGTGWVGIDLTGTAGGPPLANLPADPTNSIVYYYAYKGVDSNKTYELNARLESKKLRVSMENDGGDKNTCQTYLEATCWYEIGTDPGLDL